MLPLCPKKKAVKPEQKAEVLPVFFERKKGAIGPTTVGAWLT